jgi:hypothetical protein
MKSKDKSCGCFVQLPNVLSIIGKVFQSASFHVARRLLFFIFMSGALANVPAIGGAIILVQQQHIGLGAKQNFFQLALAPQQQS